MISYQSMFIEPQLKAVEGDRCYNSETLVLVWEKNLV